MDKIVGKISEVCWYHCDRDLWKPMNKKSVFTVGVKFCRNMVFKTANSGINAMAVYVLSRQGKE